MRLPAHPFFATPDQRTGLARERFFCGGERPSGLVADAIVQSWSRSLSVGHRPDAPPDFDPVGRGQRRAVVDRCHALVEASAAEFARLAAALHRTACRALLTDAQGVVVRASAGGERGGLLDTALRVGVDLSEHRVGSTAPGIAVATGEAVAVRGGEHFHQALGAVHCVAAPVREADGRVIGVLDLSIEHRPFGFDALGEVRLSALRIENALVARRAGRGLRLSLHTDAALLGTPLEGLVAIDADGRVAGANAVARGLLGVPPNEPVPPDLARLAGVTPGELVRAAAAGGPAGFGLPLPHGLVVHARVAAPGEPVGEGTRTGIRPVGELPSLRTIDRRVIEATLAHCDGNLSAAARRLGVSRGLLYRRLGRTADPGPDGRG